MTRWGFVVAGALVFCLVCSQLLVPALGEREVESRLTANGGTAEVTLGAVPALRLLFGDGERFEVTASELELELDPSERVFDRLDGFSVVEISITDSLAGPVELDSFELSRDGDEPYRFVASGETTATALAEFGFETVDLPGESIIDMLVEPILGDSEDPLPVDLDLDLRSDGGRVAVVGGDAEIAGVPAGPLAQMITTAIVVRL